MSAEQRGFLDTSVLLYLLSFGAQKTVLAKKLLLTGPVVSVQVLSEFTSVARRKSNFSWEEIDEVLGAVQSICRVEPLTLDTYRAARRFAERYQVEWYDALIVASAVLADCRTLCAEDFQRGKVFDRTLKVVNPFLS